MTVTPESPMARTLHNLRLTLAGTEMFQSLVGADTPEQALEHIYGFGVLDEGNPVEVTGADEGEIALPESSQPLPRAWLAFHSLISEGTGSNTWKTFGPIHLQIELTVPEELQSAPLDDQYTDFLNKLGAIIVQMRLLARTGGPYLDITSISVPWHGEGLASRNNGIPFWGAALDIHYQGM